MYSIICCIISHLRSFALQNLLLFPSALHSRPFINIDSHPYQGTYQPLLPHEISSTDTTSVELPTLNCAHLPPHNCRQLHANLPSLPTNTIPREQTNYHQWSIPQITMMIPFYQFPTSDHPRFYGAEPATFWTHCICSLTQHWFAVQLIHFENVSRLLVNTWGGDVFSRGALLPTIVQTTGFTLSFQDNITLPPANVDRRTCYFTIIHFDHRRSISHFHYHTNSQHHCTSVEL